MYAIKQGVIFEIFVASARALRICGGGATTAPRICGKHVLWRVGVLERGNDAIW